MACVTVDAPGMTSLTTLSVTLQAAPRKLRPLGSSSTVGDRAKKLSTLDLAPYAQFTLFTGIAGEAWAEAAAKVRVELGIPLGTVIIGPGQEYTDLYYDWARAREVEEDGVLLVRPDKHIGWRSITMPEDPEGALRAALASLLGR